MFHAIASSPLIYPLAFADDVRDYLENTGALRDAELQISGYNSRLSDGFGPRPKKNLGVDTQSENDEGVILSNIIGGKDLGIESANSREKANLSEVCSVQLILIFDF